MAWPNLDAGDMKTRTRTYLNETTAAFFTDPEIYRWLSYGIREIGQKALCVRRILDAVTTNATRTVAIDAYKVLYVEYVPATGRPIMLARIDPLKVGHMPLTDTYPQYWYEYGDGIAIEPLPNATYVLRVYIADIPKLVDLTFTSFTTGVGPTEWTAGTGWAGSTTAVHTGATAGDLVYNTELTASTRHTVQFAVTVCGTGGTITPKIGATSGIAVTCVGIHTQNITSPSSNEDLTFTAANSVTIDNVSIYKEADLTTSTEQTELSSAFQHLAIIYATARGLQKDSKLQQAAMLFSIVQNEIAYLRQNIVEIIPDGRDDLKYL